MTGQKITMDGKWAYRKDPFTQVRVLCVDAGDLHPVVSLLPEHDALFHHADGVHRDSQRLDLIPLQVKREPREVWVAESVDNKRMRRMLDAGLDVEEYLLRSHIRRFTRFREVMEDGEQLCLAFHHREQSAS